MDSPRSLMELSQVNFGLALGGRVAPSIYSADWFAYPYDEGIRILQKKGSTREDVAKVLNSSYISDAHDSVHRWNGIGDAENFDWPTALKDAHNNYVLGKNLEKKGKKLQENQDVDIIDLHSELFAHLANKSNETLLLKDIDYKNFTPMIESGWDVIDDIVGGIPKHGLILVLGETGLGKSFFLGKLADRFLHKYPEKTGLLVTLEMPSEEYAQRTLQMYPTFKDLGDRLYINGALRTIDEIVLEATTRKIDFLGIDFVDWLVKENSESAYAYVYKRCVEMGRLLRIPIALLAQANREGVKWKKFLTKFDARYTGMAENSAWMMIGLQKTNALDIDEPDKYPTFDEDREYILFLKLRGEWKKQVGPGAIVLEPSKQKWGGKAYRNRLWTPEYGNKTRTDKKRTK
jgi:hypothetical protein